MKTFCWTTLVAKRRLPLLAAVALFLQACGEEPQSSELRGKTMGTFWEVKIAAALEESQLQSLQTAIEKRLLEINESMSTYMPDSELSRWNANSSTEALPIGADFAQVMALALRLCGESDGAYDVSIYPLVNLWGFGPKKVERAPTDAEIEALLPDVNCRALSLENGHLRKERPQMMVDLSSIAKGFAVDELAALLEKQQQNNYLVNIGGEMRLGGQKHGQAWLIGIETPQEGGKQQAQLRLRLKQDSRALATSGNYRNFIDYAGQRAVHTLNPKTGRPESSRLLSVSVIAENAMLADALATLLMVLGDGKALDFAEKKHIAALFILADGQGMRVQHSPGFSERAEILE